MDVGLVLVMDEEGVLAELDVELVVEVVEVDVPGCGQRRCSTARCPAA